MTDQISRRSLLKRAPLAAIGATALAAAANQASAASFDSLSGSHSEALAPLEQGTTHSYVTLDQVSAGPATDPPVSLGDVQVFARTGGRVYSRDEVGVWPVSERVYDVKAYGAASVKSATGGSMTAGQTSLSFTTPVLSSADVGKRIWVDGAGAQIDSTNPNSPRVPLAATIVSISQGGQQATLDAAAQASVSGTRVEWGIDSRAAIQAAIDAAASRGGGIIEFGDVTNTYLVGEGISGDQGIIALKSNQVYRGTATIRQAGGAAVQKGLLFLDGGTGGNVVIEGLTLDGNRGNGASGSGIFVGHDNSNIVIRNVKVFNVNLSGVQVGRDANWTSIVGVRVETCVLESTGVHGVHAQVAPGIIIRGNIIRNTGVDGNGIWCSDGSHNAIITDNLIENSLSTGMEVKTGIEVKSNSGGGVVVANNHIRSVSNKGISISGTPKVAVTGNVLSDVGRATGTGIAVEIKSSNHVTVSGNAISFESIVDASNPTRITQGYKGIVIDGSSYVSVTGGTIQRGDRGIRVANGSDYVNITGLVVQRPYHSGVEIEGAGQIAYLAIQDNTFVEVGKSGIYHTAGSLTHLRVCGNRFTLDSATGLNGLWIKPGNHNVMLANNVIARDPMVENTEWGVIISGCNEVTITGNRITGFGKAGSGGGAITLPNSTGDFHAVLVANNLRGNGAGWGQLPTNRQEGLNLV